MNNNLKKILNKFRNGALIETEEEMKILERYASTGMVHFGFNTKKGMGDASLTKQGKWFVKQL